MSSSNNGPSSFALVAFASSFTLLISHLAVRQGPQIIHQPISQPLDQPPPVAAPPPPPPPPPPTPTPPAPPQPAPPALLPPPTVLIPSNGAQILYILVILVLLFGLSGVWLDSLSQSNRFSSRRNRQKKRGYVSSSDSEDDDNFPGGWRYQRDKKDKVTEDERKDWKMKMKSKLKDWEESIKMKTMSDKVKGKQRARDEDEDDQNDGGRTDDRGKKDVEVDCCGCCRILLGKCKEREIAREKERDEHARAVEQARAPQLRSQDKEQVSTSEEKIETQTQAISNIVPTATSSSSGNASTEGEKTPGSTVQQSKSAKGKEKAKDSTTDEIVEPPVPMPERDDVSVVPLTEDAAVASVLSAGGKRLSANEKHKGGEEMTQKGKADKGKQQGREGVKGEEKLPIKEAKADEGKRDSGSALTESSKETEEGKMLKGLHYISDVTKNITEEVLKQVLSQLDGSNGATKQAKNDDSPKHETPATVVDTSEKPKADDWVTKTNQKGESKESSLETTTEGEDAPKADQDKAKGKGKGAIEGEKTGVALLQVNSSKAGQQDESSNGNDKVGKSSENANAGKKAAKPSTAKSTSEKDEVVEGSKASEIDKGKGKEKASPPEREKVEAPALNLQDCEPVLESAIQVLLRSLKEQSAGKDLYYKAADYLAGSYKGVVEESSGAVNKSLDEDFVSASNKADVKVKLPWYPIKNPYDTHATDAEPHQDGKEPKKIMKTSKSEADKASDSSSDKKHREGIMRALDLWHTYKEQCDQDSKKDSRKDKGKGEAIIELPKERSKEGETVSKKEEVKTDTESDAMLRTMIETLLQDKEKERDKGAEIKDWSSRVAVEVAASDTTSKATCGYPDVIPLEAVNVSSLARAGVINKHREQIEKHSRRSTAKDTRKNIYRIKDDLVVDLKEGATSKARVLKSLLKKKAPRVDDSNGKEAQVEVKKATSTPRKSVRLQDAAGRGEGPRDIGRGETEEEARYRRLREMAKRLND